MAKEMTRYTAPNQKIIRVHKDSYNGSYLTIGTEEWQEAFKSLKRITFGVYLYLSGNANGFELTLSRRDVMDRLGVSKDTYLRAVKELEEKRYLTHKNGPVWNFYTTPVDMETDAKESDGNNEDNENHESGNYESHDYESSNHEESNESDGDENVGGMVAYTQPSCMRTRNHNGSVEATDMVASTHTEINKYRETDNTDSVGSDEPPNTDDKSDEKYEEESPSETETRDIMTKEKNPKEKETTKGKDRWVNDIDFLESISEEDTHEMYDSFCTENGFDSNGLRNHLLDRYDVRVRDIRRFYDNLCMYCEE